MIKQRYASKVAQNPLPETSSTPVWGPLPKPAQQRPGAVPDLNAIIFSGSCSDPAPPIPPTCFPMTPPVAPRAS